MSTIVDRLVGEMGYTRGTDLRAAPYDFRLAPSSNPGWAEDMKKLVEDTVERQVTSSKVDSGN